MKRFASALKTDVMVQFRNNLYWIGLAIATLVGVVFALLAKPEQIPIILPVILLMTVGGTTFLYVGSIIFFEKEQGTLKANLVSPLHPSEYLWSKIISLTFLAMLESIITIVLATGILAFSNSVQLPNIPLILAGILVIGVIYTLLGIIVMVRYTSITDFLIPMAIIVSILQLPFLHFWGVVEHWVFLVIPTSAATMLIRGAYMPLTSGEWIYALVYSAVLLVGLTLWVYKAFRTHILDKAG